MEYKEKLGKDIFEILDMVFQSGYGYQLINWAFQKNKLEISKVLYTYCIQNKKLKKDLGSDELQRLDESYKQEIAEACNLINNFYISGYSIPVPKTDPGWKYRYVNVRAAELYPEHIDTRLYCNIKVNEMALFIHDFIEFIFTQKIECWCGGEAFYDSKNQSKTRNNGDLMSKVKKLFGASPQKQKTGQTNEYKIISCDKCQEFEKMFFFQFKIPSDGGKHRFLRRDKVVFYIPSQDIVKIIVKIIEKMSRSPLGRKYFSDETPYFTHEVFPGFGYSLETNEQDILYYNEALGKKINEGLSFSKWVTLIISDIFIDFVESKRDSLNEIYLMWQKAPESEELIKYCHEQLAPFLKELREILISDSRMARLLQDASMLEVEVASLK